MISVIGGTYREINYENNSIEIYGSGLRCSKFLLENNVEVKFYTSGNDEVHNYLNEYKKVYSLFEFACEKSDYLITFKYSFALDNPSIFPNLLNINKTDRISIESENIICYGMLETEFSLIANKVIYDPQTSIKPIKFSEFGKANKLIYIVNENEAKSISGANNPIDIKKFFFEIEKVYALIIKNGPFGATLYYDDKEISISSYITNNVNKIGSGDIFTSSFAFYWLFKNLDLEASVLNASKSTALYCDKGSYSEINSNVEFKYKEFEFKKLLHKQIYLASPIFSLAEIILIDKIRSAFLDFNVIVFSPFHDIGYGDEETIAMKDLEGIEKSDIVFCILDNLDSGTLIEAGFSMAKNKKIIGYHSTCEDGSLLMLKPSNMKIFNSLTTAIYQTIWDL